MFTLIDLMMHLNLKWKQLCQVVYCVAPHKWSVVPHERLHIHKILYDHLTSYTYTLQYSNTKPSRVCQFRSCVIHKNYVYFMIKFSCSPFHITLISLMSVLFLTSTMANSIIREDMTHIEGWNPQGDKLHELAGKPWKLHTFRIWI